MAKECQRRKVTKIIDGDTFEVTGGERIRLGNYNAPELKEPGGFKAKRQLSNLIPPGSLPTVCPVGKSYGRTVAEVTYKGKNISKEMKKKK